LENPPPGLEKELQHFYFAKGRLETVIDHAKRLIDMDGGGGSSTGTGEQEEDSGEIWNAEAIGSLTMGAKLTLKVSFGPRRLERRRAER